jgi:outer membrane autotransporter protein
LDIAPGASITGDIANSGTISVLNITAVAASANFDLSTAGVNITGNQPISTNLNLSAPSSAAYVAVGNRTAGVDKSAFGANNHAIRHVSNSVGRLANTNGVIQSIGTKIAKQNADPYATASDLCADGAPAQPGQIGISDFWIRGFTGRNRVDATASSVDYINTYSGGAVGIERDWSENTRAGAFIGAGITDNSLGGGLGGSEADLLFAGAYATKTWGTIFAKVGMTGGSGKNTCTRNIAAVTPETALASYDSWYVSPEVSVGRVFDLGQSLGGTFSVTPVLSVRYVYASQDGYTEAGATNNLTMNSSHSTTIEERAELKFSYATQAFEGYGLKLNASVGGIGQQNDGGAMSGTLLGAPLSFATPGDDNTTGFVGGLGFEINRGKYTFTASGDYVRLSGGNADLSANVVFGMKF